MITTSPILLNASGQTQLRERYRAALLDDVIPFWLHYGLDAENGGLLSCLDRDGRVVDTDKSMWAQGRTAWMLATLYNEVEARPQWLDAARSCLHFLREFGESEGGKMWFSTTREGAPLRMRRYVYSESFAAIASAAYFKASGESRAFEDANRHFAAYLRHSFEPGAMPAKVETETRPMKGLGAHMIAIVTAQELRWNLGDENPNGRTYSEQISASIAEIERDFLKPDLKVLLETVGPNGEILPHFDGRTLNPGHAIECAWFIMREGLWQSDTRLIQLGAQILDWMWKRGWDEKFGGLFYFRDLNCGPVAEYWHDMKFWWPHNEAEIATLLAWKLTGEARFAQMHQEVHDWSFSHFPDPEYGEWFGYLHRDGRLSTSLKGNLWKSCFHLPRMLWLNGQLLESDARF